MRRIRTGVVGFGLAGRVFHAPFVKAVPSLELTAIVQRSGDSAKEAYPDAAQVRSYEDLLASDVELVVLGTPTPTHYALTKQALLAGKHVVCDKPTTVSVSQAEEVESLAAKQGLLLFPFHNRRWDGDFKTMQALIASGQLGRIVSLDSRFDRYRPEPKPGVWREEEEGGGLLYDIGPHLIDQALTLFGTPKRLWANLRSDRDQGSVPDGVDIHLTFDGPGNREVLVRLGTTSLAADPAPRYRLHGTRGTYVKHGLDPQEPTLVAGGHVPPVGSSDPWLPEAEAMWGTLTIAPDPAVPSKLERSPLQTIPGDYRDYYINVGAAILGEAEPILTPRAGVRTARVIELATESSRTGCSISIDAAGW